MRNPFYAIFEESSDGVKIYVSDVQPTNAPVGSLWIDTSQDPNKVYILKTKNQWQEVEALDQAVYIGSTEPQSPVKGLIWFNSDTKQLAIYDGQAWQLVSAGGGDSSPISVHYNADEKTIHLDDQTNTFSVKFNNDETKEPGYVWDNKRIQKEALVKALIFG